ncbi:hypothetical protein [Antarctobacter jejuensis]|uniref:hypothetical protein n=1 Tax=Antarctobacter jejuensis TaxID=1439938 RepID=UPI003FD43E0B
MAINPTGSMASVIKPAMRAGKERVQRTNAFSRVGIASFCSSSGLTGPQTYWTNGPGGALRFRAFACRYSVFLSFAWQAKRSPPSAERQNPAGSMQQDDVGSKKKAKTQPISH